jgi:hypothetical protein
MTPEDSQYWRSLEESDPAQLQDQGGFSTAAFLVAGSIIVLPAVAVFRAWDWIARRSQRA